MPMDFARLHPLRLSPLRVGLLSPFAGLLLFAAPLAGRQLADVFQHQKVDTFEGGFEGTLTDGVEFGHALAAIGDLDGNGISELAVGAPGYDPQTFSRGSLWILFPASDGTVDSHHFLASGVGGFVGPLSTNGCFGRAIAPLGDFDGALAADIAVGEPQDCTLFSHGPGKVWLLYLDPSGAPVDQRSIGEGIGGFTGLLDDNDAFGHAIVNLGDLDGNGAVDLAVGAPGDDEGGFNRGAVWILFLAPDGSVLSHKKIAFGLNGFAGVLADSDEFGSSLASFGDLDGDGAPELAVGAQRTAGGGVSRGAVWILDLALDGTVTGHVKIGEGLGGFTGLLDDADRFGSALAALGDLDGDGEPELAVGAEGTEALPGDEFTAPGRGVVWLLFLDSARTVKEQRLVGQGAGGFMGSLGTEDRFGSALAALPNLDGGVSPDLAVGAWGDALAGTDRGAAWTLFIDTLPTAEIEPYGCDANPPGSLISLGPPPTPGSVVVLGIDNPLGTQAPGSFPFLIAALAASPSYVPFLSPCGLMIPGLGMHGPGSSGELLIDFGALPVPPFPGPAWTGPGMPSAVPIPVPANPGLIGLSVFTQGVLFDPTIALGVEVGLTQALELRIGI